jgi:hypothetical protein
MGAPYFAESFSPLPGRCFRLVGDDGGRPSHCPEPVRWSGTFRAPDGRRYRAQACDGHRDALVNVRPAARPSARRPGDGG